MSVVPARPRALYRWTAGLLLAGLLCLLVLDWNLGVFSSTDALGHGFERLGTFLSSFTRPDLSAAMLERAAGLTLDTLSIALLGVLLGLVVGYPIALGASRCIVVGDPDQPRSRIRRRLERVFLEVCRLLLDVLRGVPDFAWALLVVSFTGIGPVTGVLALGISIAGILGKIFSEQWDAIDPDRYRALRSSGAGALNVFLFGIQPLAGRAMLSFTLMRTECAIRNASVIGVIGGGGLGAALWDEFADGNYDNVVTVLLFMLALTASADLLANALRYQLRVDPSHPRASRDNSLRAGLIRRTTGLGAVAALLLGCFLWLLPALGRAADELSRLEWEWMGSYYGSLLVPDLSLSTVGDALFESRVPVAAALLATCGALVVAGLLSYYASVAFQLHSDRFTGERISGSVKALRVAKIASARGIGLLFRGIPEVAWVLILGAFFRQGITAAVLAMALHSAGVLLRVFAETVDNVPYRRLEQVSGGCRPQMFAYGALPESWPDWKTYTVFQFEVNVRMGVVLGMVGAGGLGHAFHSALLFDHLHRASTFLLAMVVLTVIIDRSSRALGYRRLKC